MKCVTTKGRIIPSTTFSTEDDTSWDTSLKNDDKILTTCLVLCKNQKESNPENAEGKHTLLLSGMVIVIIVIFRCKHVLHFCTGQPRRLEREIVLLTEDRNLRVKAYARDVPVRELPDFMRWWSALG